MNNLLKKNSKSSFDPKVNNVNDLPDEPGNYIFCLKKNSKFPKTDVKPVFKIFIGFRVVYTGIAKGSLRKRDYHDHFTKNNAGYSTLRKSLGTLFGYKQIPRDKNPASDKTKFSLKDEMKLSAWMQNNLIMFYYANDNFNHNENLLIDHFKPPLNLEKNESSEFRTFLKALRAKGKKETKAVTNPKLPNNTPKELVLNFNKTNKKKSQYQKDEPAKDNDGCLKIILIVAFIVSLIYVVMHIN